MTRTLVLCLALVGCGDVPPESEADMRWTGLLGNSLHLSGTRGRSGVLINAQLVDDEGNEQPAEVVLTFDGPALGQLADSVTVTWGTEGGSSSLTFVPFSGLRLPLSGSHFKVTAVNTGSDSVISAFIALGRCIAPILRTPTQSIVAGATATFTLSPSNYVRAIKFVGADAATGDPPGGAVTVGIPTLVGGTYAITVPGGTVMDWAEVASVIFNAGASSCEVRNDGAADIFGQVLFELAL